MLLSFRDPWIDPRRWAPHGEWSPESREAATERLPAFARDFFCRLLAEFPKLATVTTYLRWSSQPGDVYAFFDGSPGFVVQIDPDMGYIIVIAGSGIAEYGDWGDNDQVQDAIGHIRSLMAGFKR